ncbi:MAG: hypothetical protein HY738_23880 [Bacteroidia bacterium]|nr:hypothetical protein [Bacteroidia bacterium]
MPFNFNEWFDKTGKEDNIIGYYGEITSEVISNALDDIEIRLKQKNADLLIIRKIYNIVVESLQNLFHHSLGNIINPSAFNKRFAAFFVVSSQNGYSIITGNYIKSDKIKFLKERIEQLNKLSKDELKSLYKMILNNQEFSDKGGGGLGMIDIARRSGNKFLYYFFTIDKEYSFFQFEIKVF